MKRLLVNFCLAVLLLLLCGVASAPRAEALTFASPLLFGAGVECRSVAVGDFNGDGRQDIATANSLSWSASVLLGIGNCTFAPGTSYPTGADAYCVAAGDFDNDGHIDLAVANARNEVSTVSVLWGDGSGDFPTKSDFATGVAPCSVAVGDFNADNKLDLATANNVDGSASVLLGNGDRTFAPKTDYSFGDVYGGSHPFSIAVGDFNGDGSQDLVTALAGPGWLSVMLGNGDGSFASPSIYLAGELPKSVAVGDFNGDGKQDLVASLNTGATGVVVLLGKGDGTFAAGTAHYAGGTPEAVNVGDFNGDGNEDLLVPNWVSKTANIMLGNGRGGFAQPVRFATTAGPVAAVVGDFNRDGKPDLVTANPNSSAKAVTILRNTTKPAIASLKPTQGKVGTTVTIIGSPAGWSFGGTRGTAKVYIGGKAVTKYVSWSKYQIKVRVPSLAKGKKAVTVKTPAGKSNVKYFTVL